MSALARTQREFMRAITSAGALPPGMEVYRRGLLANQRGALAAAYPVVRRLVGETFFDEAADRYAAAFPPASGDLHLHGGAFAAFLRAYPYAAALPYLPDVARLEWAVHESHHAPDAPAFDPASLAAIDPEDYPRLRLLFAPAFRRVESPHAIHALWLANQPEHDGTPAAGGAQRVVVTRPREGVRLRVVYDEEWDFLVRVTDGAPLGDALDALGDRAAGLPGWLARYAAEEALAGIERIPRA